MCMCGAFWHLRSKNRDIDMKKIVFHLNCLERGGAERVVANLSGQFVQNGYQVWIATEWQAKMSMKLTRVSGACMWA